MRRVFSLSRRPKAILTTSLAVAAAAAVLVTASPIEAAAFRDRDNRGSCVRSLVKGERLGDSLDELVTSGTLTAEQRDAVADALGSDRTDRACGGIHLLRERAVGNAVRDLLGMDRKEVRDAWQNGQSLAEMAEAKGRSRADLIDVITNAIDSQLTKLVENGRITEERKNEIMEQIAPRIDAAIDIHKGELRAGANGESTPESTSIESIAI